MENTEKIVINKAMKNFRVVKAEARKDYDTNINALFYIGSRLTPLQINLFKDAIYSVSELNDTLGKDVTDDLIREILSDVLVDMFLESVMK